MLLWILLFSFLEIIMLPHRVQKGLAGRRNHIRILLSFVYLLRKLDIRFSYASLLGEISWETWMLPWVCYVTDDPNPPPPPKLKYEVLLPRTCPLSMSFKNSFHMSCKEENMWNSKHITMTFTTNSSCSLDITICIKTSLTKCQGKLLKSIISTWEIVPL